MRDRVVLIVNGRRHELAYEESVITLSEFLRRRGLVGTKIVCNEGDCGACSVLVGRASSDSGELCYHAVDSCILFPYQLDHAHVVTVEGLGDRGRREAQAADDSLTPVQEAMVRCHGSQCGFCTPGFVMAMHAMVEEELPLDHASLRYGLSGNLCRCTGYQQILDAGTSVDTASVRRVRDLYPDQMIWQQLAPSGRDCVRIEGEQTIFIPRTIDQAVEFKAANPAATIVSGGTDIGVLYNHGRAVPSDLLCLSDVEDFDHVVVDENQLRIGGGATWTGIERCLERENLFPQYHHIITRFGSPQIRNAGTLAGNLATGSPIADSIPFHLVMDSQLRLISPRGVRAVRLNDFYTGYRENILADDELIAEIITPLLLPTERLMLFKISKRRDLDISTLTFALWINVVDDSIAAARLALGGVGPRVLRIRQCEEYLQGKPVSESVFQEAGVLAREQITPWSDVRGSADFRFQLTENLMLKAYWEMNDQRSTIY